MEQNGGDNGGGHGGNGNCEEDEEYYKPYCRRSYINRAPTIVFGGWMVNGTAERLINPSLPNPMPFEIESNEYATGWQFWEREQNRIGGIKIGYRKCAFVKLKTFNLGFIPELQFPALNSVVNRVVSLLNDPSNNNVKFFFGPISTSLTNITAYECDKRGRMFISNGASDPTNLRCPTSGPFTPYPPCNPSKAGKKRFNSVFQILPYFDNLGSGFGTFLASAIDPLVPGKPRGAYFFANDPFSIGVGQATVDAAEDLGSITILTRQLTYSSQVTEARIDAIINEIRSLSYNPDFVVIASLPTFCAPMMEGLVRNNFRPKALGMYCAVGKYDAPLDYLMSVTLFSCRNNYYDYQFNIGMQEFCDIHRNNNIAIIAGAYSAAKAATVGIEKAQSATDINKIVQKLEDASLTHLYGVNLRFDQYHGMQDLPVVVSQSAAVTNNWEVISPNNIKERNIIYPMPPFPPAPNPIEEQKGVPNVDNKNNHNSGFVVVASFISILFALLF